MNIREVIDELDSVIQPNSGGLSLFLRMADLAYEAEFGDPNRYIVHIGNDIVFEPPTLQQMNFFRRILIIFADLETIATIVYRARWTVLQHPGLFNADECIGYLQADIHAFHAEIRSLFDSIALTTKQSFGPSSYPRGRKLPPESFFELRKWCHNFENRNLLGAGVASLISNCDWFDELKEYRESIFHREKDVFVRWLGADDIIFQTLFGRVIRPVYQGPREFLWKGWIRFAPYVGYYVGRLLCFLDRYCEFAAHQFNIDLHQALLYTPTRMSAVYACIHDTQVVLHDALNPRRVFDKNWDAITWC